MGRRRRWKVRMKKWESARVLWKKGMEGGGLANSQPDLNVFFGEVGGGEKKTEREKERRREKKKRGGGGLNSMRKKKIWLERKEERNPKKKRGGGGGERKKKKKRKRQRPKDGAINILICTHLNNILSLFLHGPQRRSLRTSSVASPPVVVIHGFASIGIDG